MAKQFRVYDNEKADLYSQIRELEAAAGNYQQIKTDYELRAIFTKWLFISKVRKLRSISEAQARFEMATQVEKQESERQLNLFIAQNPHIDLKQDLHDAKSEIVELCQALSDLKYEKYVRFNEAYTVISLWRKRGIS